MRSKNPPFILYLFPFVFFLLSMVASNPALAEPISYSFAEKVVGGGNVYFDTRINKRDFSFGDDIEIQIDLTIDSEPAIRAIKRLNGIYLLLRAERIFDKEGRYHQFTNNYASTILTPSGLPIENYDIFCDYIPLKLIEYIDDLRPENKYYGRSNDTPLYNYAFIEKRRLRFVGNRVSVEFNINDKISKAVLEGYYRFQVSVLAKRGRNFHRINFLPIFGQEKIQYSDWDLAILARNVSYLPVIKIGSPKIPRMIWTLFTKYYSNGTQGVVSNEDSSVFQFNSRHSVPAKFILPLSSETTYNLEPDFPTLFAKHVLELELGSKWDFQTPIPLNYQAGELSVVVEKPDGTIANLGIVPFAAQSKTGATTNSNRFKFVFDQYGKHRILMSGWIEDFWGNRYNGGGTYEVWIANRLTFATSVKPGTPFEVGNSYPPSVIVHPPCPADVKVDVILYRNSSKEDTKRVVIEGRANKFGYFYPRKKFEKMVFDSPGEYLSEITATYTDEQGRLWMGNQYSGSVVAPSDSILKVDGASPAHYIKTAVQTRGNSYYEGKLVPGVSPEFKDYTCCTLFPFPYNSGDILYIANSFGGDNGIRPIITIKGTPLFSTTSNGYQPQGYPEFLEKQSYAYMSAIRSGFSARFMVGQDTGPMGDTYWQSGANFAGHQINNSYNGDLPQDIYEFLGGVVYRDLKKGVNLYGIYASMGIVIPQGSYANRVSAPLEEPLLEVNGKQYYLFDAGAPLPGLVLEVGDILRAGAMIFPPIGGVSCTKKVTCPFGKQYVFLGTTNKIGLAKLVASQGDEVPITEAGVYQVETQCEYQGKKGDVLGSGSGKYFIYAIDARDTKNYFELELPARFSIKQDQILRIYGHLDDAVKEATIYYTIIMPGVIVDEGTVSLENRKFSYGFSPRDIAVQFPNYDLVAYDNPTIPRMADTVIFTFFLRGLDYNGKSIYSVKRFIIRGDQGIVFD